MSTFTNTLRCPVLGFCLVCAVATFVHAETAFRQDYLARGSAAAQDSVDAAGTTAMSSHVLAAEDMEVADLAFSPDSKLAAWITSTYKLSMCEVATGRMAVIFGGVETQRDPLVSRVGFSERSDLLIAGRRGAVEVWEIATGSNRVIHRPDDGDAAYDRLWIAPNGIFAAINNLESSWKRLHLYAPTDELPRVDDIFEAEAIHAAIFSSDGQRFAMLVGNRSRSEELSILRWDVGARCPLTPIRCPNRTTGRCSLAYSPDGGLLACLISSEVQARMYAWDVSGILAEDDVEWPVLSAGREVVFAANGQVVTENGVFAVGCAEPVWIPSRGRRRDGTAAPFAVSEDGNVVAALVATGDSDQIELMSAATGNRLRVCSLTGSCRKMRLSPEGKHLLTVSDEVPNVISLWSTKGNAEAPSHFRVIDDQIRDTYRIWTRRDGTQTKMKLRYESTSAGVVTLASQQGKKFRVESHSLSKEDQDLIRALGGGHEVPANGRTFRRGERVVTNTRRAELMLFSGEKISCGVGAILDIRSASEGRLLASFGGHTGWIGHDTVIPLEHAITYFTERIKENPDDPFLRVARGSVFLEKGEVGLALEDANWALRKQHNAAFYNLRGVCHDRRHEWNEAIDDFFEAIALEPNDAASFFNRAGSYISMGNDVKAMADIVTAIRLAPMNSRYYHQRGQVHLMRQDYEEAFSDFSYAIQLDPSYSPTYRERATVCMEHRGDLDGALKDIDRALELDPAMPIGYVVRAMIWSRMGDTDKALADVNNAIQLDGNHEGALSFRAHAYLAMERNDEAIRDAKKLITLDSKAAQSVGRGIFGMIRLREGKDIEAAVDLMAAVALEPTYAVAHLSLGIALWNLTNHDKAREAWERAAQLDPTLQPVIDALLSQAR